MSIDHLGPLVIGEQQFKKEQAQKTLGNSHLGPYAGLTPDQIVAWKKDGSPLPWQEWLIDYETRPDLPPPPSQRKK